MGAEILHRLRRHAYQPVDLASLWSSVSTGPWHTYVPPQIPDGTVNALGLDEEGQTLWVGTDSGLACCDGHEWQLYEPGAGLPAKVRALGGDGAELAEILAVRISEWKRQAAETVRAGHSLISTMGP
jgi:ligand-binding sensor domain-containing protein